MPFTCCWTYKFYLKEVATRYANERFGDFLHTKLGPAFGPYVKRLQLEVQMRGLVILFFTPCQGQLLGHMHTYEMLKKPILVCFVFWLFWVHLHKGHMLQFLAWRLLKAHAGQEGLTFRQAVRLATRHIIWAIIVTRAPVVVMQSPCEPDVPLVRSRFCTSDARCHLLHLRM